MVKKWKIIHKDERAQQKQQICFYCDRFFCSAYHNPRNRMVCSGILPKWEFLYRLMRDVRATDTCQKFKLSDVYKQI